MCVDVCVWWGGLWGKRDEKARAKISAGQPICEAGVRLCSHDFLFFSFSARRSLTSRNILFILLFYFLTIVNDSSLMTYPPPPPLLGPWSHPRGKGGFARDGFSGYCQRGIFGGGSAAGRSIEARTIKWMHRYCSLHS